MMRLPMTLVFLTSIVACTAGDVATDLASERAESASTLNLQGLVERPAGQQNLRYAIEQFRLFNVTSLREKLDEQELELLDRIQASLDPAVIPASLALKRVFPRDWMRAANNDVEDENTAIGATLAANEWLRNVEFDEIWEGCHLSNHGYEWSDYDTTFEAVDVWWNQIVRTSDDSAIAYAMFVYLPISLQAGDLEENCNLHYRTLIFDENGTMVSFSGVTEDVMYELIQR